MSYADRYETVNISLSEKPEWLLERNPNGTVPVLEQDDVVIYESLIVADYLNTVYPNPVGSQQLLPADPYRKARDDLLIDYYGKKVRVHAVLLMFFPSNYRVEENHSLSLFLCRFVSVCLYLSI